MGAVEIVRDAQEIRDLAKSMAERAVDAKTGTLGVRGVFPNPEGLLKPGQYAKVRALLENRKGALTVPQRAVIDVQGAKSVYVVDAKSKIEARPVVIGGIENGTFVIDSGLTPIDMVVTEGVSKVRPGVTVKVAGAPQDNAARAATPAAPEAAKP